MACARRRHREEPAVADRDLRLPICDRRLSPGLVGLPAAIPDARHHRRRSAGLAGGAAAARISAWPLRAAHLLLERLDVPAASGARGRLDDLRPAQFGRVASHLCRGGPGHRGAASAAVPRRDRRELRIHAIAADHFRTTDSRRSVSGRLVAAAGARAHGHAQRTVRVTGGNAGGPVRCAACLH